MKFDDVWIAGAGAALGNLVSAADAVADGRYPRGWAMWSGMTSVSVSELFPGELAVVAGKEALLSSKIDPGAIGLHVFSSMTFPGLYAWPVSHFVARQLIPPFSGLSLWNNAFSASSLAAIEIGASMMCGRPDTQAALLTTGDRFYLPDVDRWKHDRGLVFGDGGGALVLSRAGGWAQLKCVVSWTDQELEEMHRGKDVLCGMGETPWPVDQSKRYNDYFAKDGVVLPKMLERSCDNAKKVFSEALTEAEVRVEDLRWVIAPFTGRTMFLKEFSEPLGFHPENSLLEFGCTLGHLGAGDQMVGLREIMTKNLASSGDFIALLGVGIGQTWSAAVLEIC